MNDEQTPAYLRRLALPRQRLGWAFIGLLLGWAVVSLVLSERGLVDLWELEEQETELRAELEDLQEKAAEVDWELTEPGGMEIERPAREKFEMQRPGEIVYHFAPVTAVEDATPAPPEKIDPEGLTSTK